jgi:hypothetical protein
MNDITVELSGDRSRIVLDDLVLAELLESGPVPKDRMRIEPVRSRYTGPTNVARNQEVSDAWRASWSFVHAHRLEPALAREALLGPFEQEALATERLQGQQRSIVRGSSARRELCFQHQDVPRTHSPPALEQSGSLDVARISPHSSLRYAEPERPTETSDRVPERAGPAERL